MILASGSPRRAQILADAGLTVDVVPSGIDEGQVFSSSGALDELVQKVALRKASSVAAKYPGVCVLGADTIVILDGRVLGKPNSSSDASEMLHRLSGRSHHVMTGVAVVDDRGESHVGYVTTSVVFRVLGQKEIADYVGTGSPLDKAGGYGIQDSSFAPVSSYDECYLNVVGLPMCATSELLEMSGLVVPGTINCPGHERHNEVAKKVPG